MSKIIVFSTSVSTQETPGLSQPPLPAMLPCQCTVLFMLLDLNLFYSPPLSVNSTHQEVQLLLGLIWKESFPCLPGAYYTMLIWSPRIVSLYSQLLNYSVKLIYLRKTVLAPSGQLIRDQSSKIPDRNKSLLIFWLNVYMRMFIFILICSLFLKFCITWDVKNTSQLFN